MTWMRGVLGTVPLSYQDPDIQVHGTQIKTPDPIPGTGGMLTLSPTSINHRILLPPSLRITFQAFESIQFLTPRRD